MIYTYLFVAAITLYCVRMLPLVLIRREIKSKFIKSFLYYVPYVTLSVMTFPAVITATEHPISGTLGFVAGVIVAYIDGNLFRVAISASGAALICELIMKYM